MEEVEPKPPQTALPTQTPIPNPTDTLQNLPPPNPLPPSQNKKRPLDNSDHLQKSEYYKMRAVLRDLRPRFIEVLRTCVALILTEKKRRYRQSTRIDGSVL